MDLDALGEQLAARKAELMQGKPAKAGSALLPFVLTFAAQAFPDT
jgi:hypothetical protein